MKNAVKILHLGLALLLLTHASFGQKKVVGSVGFYNVENLFDTEDDPLINDEEFLPEGAKKWNNEKYQDKLAKLSKVLSEMAYGVDILGLAEVENKSVIEDLISTPSLKKYNYAIVHRNSPDGRGIDVALIYKSDRFKVINTTWIQYPDPDYKTREMLMCSGIFFGDTLTIAVNHWPSRRSGPERRNKAGARLKKAVDSLYEKSPSAKVILVGDFNDDPRNASVKKELRAEDRVKKLLPGGLFNTSAATYKEGYGTLYYKGAWNLFDQVIVSEPMINGTGLTFQKNSFSIFGPPWMRNKDGQYAGGPFRAFAYDKYIGGYSDHFPVYILLEK
ncbi:MAG: endonuclease/exonuclease/phosphatase family protein [Bacteroidota bacterium]